MYKPTPVQVTVTKFQADNGLIYDTEIEALRADELIREKADHVFHFSRTFSGQRLLEKYGLATYGTWRVEGEDSNPDLGGHHHQPLLGYFEGTLQDVIKHAYTLKGWMTWGGGGEISLVKPLEVVKL